VEQAEAQYRRALELAERQRANDRGLPYQGLARLRLSANRPADAVDLAKRAVELGPRDAAGHKLLARVYWDLGRQAVAVAEWKISAELDPTDSTALYRLYRGYLSLGEAEKARAALGRYRQIAGLYGTN
jgi:tetratricopeptide (TPR) repeat protein